MWSGVKRYIDNSKTSETLSPSGGGNFLIFPLISKYLTNILPITNLYTVLGALGALQVTSPNHIDDLWKLNL